MFDNIKTFHKKFLRVMSSRQLRILGYNGGSWTNGGCLILAKALRCWSKNKFQLAVVISGGIMQHFFVMTPGNYALDGDGLQTLPVFYDKMVNLEQLNNPSLVFLDDNQTFNVKHYPFNLIATSIQDIPCCPVKIQKTFNLLNKVFGSYKKYF